MIMLRLACYIFLLSSPFLISAANDKRAVLNVIPYTQASTAPNVLLASGIFNNWA